MTTAPERRTATLTELVAQEIDSARGRRRMSQAQLARSMGKTPMWVSLRLRGLQPIDLNDLLLFARALQVEVHDLLPGREETGRATPLRLTEQYPAVAVQSPSKTRPGNNRPSGRAGTAPSPTSARTAYVERSPHRGPGR